MSNFICSECGMTNIDCGRDDYKTPKEIELEKKVHILNEANMKLENELGHFADLSKKVERLQERNEKLEKMAFQYTPEEWNTMLRTIERLQEQLHEANEVIIHYAEKNGYMKAIKYLNKFGVR